MLISFRGLSFPHQGQARVSCDHNKFEAILVLRLLSQAEAERNELSPEHKKMILLLIEPSHLAQADEAQRKKEKVLEHHTHKISSAWEAYLSLQKPDHQSPKKFAIHCSIQVSIQKMGRVEEIGRADRERKREINKMFCSWKLSPVQKPSFRTLLKMNREGAG